MTQVSSFYLHVPFCKHLCNYCDFYKLRLNVGVDQFGEYHRFLSDSVKRHQVFLAEHGVTWQPLETVYLGGGTPSLWGVRGAEFFKNDLLPVELSKNVEFTMEVDPGTWTNEMLEAWQEIGLNRISIGTQTLNNDFLKIMDRVHSLDESLNLLAHLQKNNWNFSLDFLLGIPFSHTKKRDIKTELDTFLSYSPKHVSLYILNARLKYPLIQDIPDEEYIRDEYLFVSEYLNSKGFHHYEVSNFALKGFESRHNQKYWRGQSVAALGPTGTGYLALSDEKSIRYKWKVSKAEVEIENLGPQELSLEKTYLALRTSEGIPFQEAMEPLLESWERLQYAVLENGRVKLTALGYLMLDSLMDDLFRWEVTFKGS